MNLVLTLIVLATVFNGLLAGASLDTSLVKLPARRRIGNRAYAAFARGNDLGNGKIVYPVWAISAALLVLVATIVAYVGQPPMNLLLPLAIASLTSILHFIGTSRAAPVMLGLANAPDEESSLKQRFDQFERWHAFRMVFQVLTFFVLLWALILAR